MKLEYAEIYLHMLQTFGEPVYVASPSYYWRPSIVDRGIEVGLTRTGTMHFVVNGNRGASFIPDISRLSFNSLRHLRWQGVWSWQYADELAAVFGTYITE